MIRRRTNSRGRRAHVAQFFDSLGCGNTGFLLFCPVVLSGMPRGHKSTIDLERNISINFRNNIADNIHFQNQLLVFASLLVSRATYSRRPRFVVRLACSFPRCSGGAQGFLQVFRSGCSKISFLFFSLFSSFFFPRRDSSSIFGSIDADRSH